MNTRGPLPNRYLYPLELVRANPKLVSPPSVYLALQDAVQNPRASAMDIAQIISSDSSLTARMLKLVNSPVFGFPRRIASVSEAVALVGTRHIMDLATATSILYHFKDIPGDNTLMNTFWKESMLTGILAKTLAMRRQQPNLERFFVAGLLHDIGSLIIYLNLPSHAATIVEECQAHQLTICEAEIKVLGFAHTDVGEALLKLWNLPKVYQQCAAFHHFPEQCKDPCTELGYIHLADQFAHLLCLTNSGVGHQPMGRFYTAYWDDLNMEPNSLPVLFAQAKQSLDDVMVSLLSDD